MELERITRRYLKPEERRQIAERCESSGLSRSEFARRHWISLSSLQRWLSEARNAPKEVP
jgi:transposase-like protein